MHGLILAGGEGTRLRSGGITLPKPLVQVAGQPQVVRLVETLAALGCETITCVVRDGVPDVERTIAATDVAVPIRVVTRRPPTSLHSLREGLDVVPPGPVFCTMVDTVMPPADWQAVWRETRAALDAGAEAVLVVTSHVDDEKPLWVELDAGGRVTEVRDAPPADVVTGGVYAFGESVRPGAAAAVAEGLRRMRAFLRVLVAKGHRVAAVEVPRIVDLDRPSDLDDANRWLALNEREE
jgi:NDP-sugar pyrophosphorylase family protein